MKAIIIEDEVVAAQNLQRLIEQIEPEAEIMAVLESVEESIAWFLSYPSPDLVFMDIHLSDGSSFSIFDKVIIDFPVIFTTAYDQYALNAFKVNGIDYLLKPIDNDELKRAIAKYKSFTGKGIDNDMVAKLLSAMKTKTGEYKSRFLIPHKDKFLSLNVEDIAFIYAENKTGKIVSLKGNEYKISRSLEELFKQLDPTLFFRANRQFIISRNAVQDIYTWFDSKLALTLNVEPPEKIIISRARVQDFKDWYTG
jgi:Response regulator of the LytR/AlgR family